MQKATHVSTIIPTYNGLKLLKANLPAVLACLGNKDELIIVDDASSDGTIYWLKKYFNARVRTDGVMPGTIQFVGSFSKLKKKVKVIILVNDKNQRFGESCNRGVQAATGDLIFLINNDVAPEKDILKSLTPHFETKDKVNGEAKQASGGELRSKRSQFGLSRSEREYPIGGAQGQQPVFAVGCMEIEEIAGKKVKGGKNKLWFEKGLFMHSRADQYTSGKTAWTSGGSAMFDRKKWLELGGFDKIYYPAYWEDIDLSFRAKQKGWQVLFEEKAVTNHNHESTNIDVFGQKKLNQMSWQNADRFVMKNGNLWQKLNHLLWKPYWWWKRK